MARKFLNGIDLTSQKITNLADPTAATDGVNLQTLQSLIRGLSWKGSVRAASTANVTLASPGTTMDGVTLAANDRVLLKNQTAPAENGIYDWTASGSALTRSTDADSATEIQGAAVYVREGTTNADKAYTQTVDSVTLNTTGLTWTQFGGGNAYTAGNGLGLAGSVFSVTPDTGIQVTGSGVKVDNAVVVRKYAVDVPTTGTSVTITHNLGTLDVTVAVFENTGGAEVFPDVLHATTNTLTLTFSATPTAAQYRCVVHG